MKLRAYILLFLLVFGLTPLILAVLINLPLVLERTTLFYQRAYLQNLRADFRDLDQHLASRHEMIRLLSKLPEPGLILGDQGEADQIDRARARYTGWINRILDDQRDIIQILFAGDDGQERFWLVRDPHTLEWQPTPQVARPPNQQFLTAGLELQPGAVLVSRIGIDTAASAGDPRRFMTMNLIARLGGAQAEQTRGVVVLTIDIGGLAQFYRDTLWVNQDGSELRPGQPASDRPEAFERFPGLADLFAQGTLAVWTGRQGRQMLWVPMFLTEDGMPLWVGRAVDPSPIDSFRDALMARVLTIICLLVLAVMVAARWIAARAERFGKTLAGAIGGILRDGAPLRFDWRGPREIRKLGIQLTALARTHAEHLSAAHAHARELEKSNRYKSEFLANVSHELRTPLNSILLLSKMLAAETGGLPASQRRQARVIHEAGRDLRTMIDNILDISRIEAGHLSLFPEWVEPAPMLDELLELMRPQLADKPVTLHRTIAPDAPARIFTDRDKLRQILKNFLANAIKFTERGRITLSLATRDDPERPVALGVTDTGIGIPADKQSLIFEAFQQADGSTRRRYGGTGLGLSISRELATRLGGCIEVESAPGAGARFTLHLPLRLAAEPAEYPSADTWQPDPEPVAPIRRAETPTAPEYMGENMDGNTEWVLIVERDVRGLAQLAAACAARGLRVQSAADPDEALETLQEDGGGCILILLADPRPEALVCDTIRTLLQQIQGAPPMIAVLADRAEPPSTPSTTLSCPDGPDRIVVLTRPVAPERLAILLAELPSSARAPRP